MRSSTTRMASCRAVGPRRPRPAAPQRRRCSVRGRSAIWATGRSTTRLRNLTWEKKDPAVGVGTDPGNLHAGGNRYSWAGRRTLNPSVYCQPDAAAAATCAAQTGAAECVECGVGEGTCNVDPFVQGAITTVWDWVNQVNAAAYAGHTDWRLPTSAGCCGFPSGELAELESIVDLGFVPTIDPLFGPTIANRYGSASTYSPGPLNT